MLDKREFSEKSKNGWVLVILSFLGIVLFVSGLILVLRMSGKSKISTAVAGEVSNEDVMADNEEVAEDQIIYNGKAYKYNEDLTTILVMGIDKETNEEVGGESWSVEAGSQRGGGQADALFLMVLNPHTSKVSVLAINRNTMTDVDIFDDNGNYVGREEYQICIQHGFGDGKEESCERQVRTVSRFLDGIPIHAYAAISMDSIPELNDAVGGIEVEVLDDIIYPEYDMDLHQGDVVTLHGEKAYWYVRLRNEAVFNSNQLRLERQKQYLTTFAAVAKNQATKDIRVAVDLFQIAQKYMVTDIDLSQFTYLAGEALSYDFDITNLYTFDGEASQPGKFEEFRVDPDSKRQIMIDLFYEPVEEDK